MDKTLVAVAIDDEPKALEIIEILASKIPFLQIKATFTDAFEAMPFLQNHKIDLLFLDIKMPDISGIDFVKTLPKVPMIIFTTAYSEYAVQGFELDAIDYLLKPFSLARFMKACNKALANMLVNEGDARDFLFVKTGYEEEKVFYDEISYIEADGNYLQFVLKNRKLLSRQTMADVLQLLPESLFVRVHRSYIVACYKISKIAKQAVFVQDKEIPIGVSYEEKLLWIRDKLKGID